MNNVFPTSIIRNNPDKKKEQIFDGDIPYKDYSELNETKGGWRKNLELFGVAVVPGVLNPQEIKDAQNGMLSTIEMLTSANKRKPKQGFKREDPNTWSNHAKILVPSHGMTLNNYEVGHAQFVWDIRQKAKVIKPFVDIWDTDNLLVSFDGFSFGLDAKLNPNKSTKSGSLNGSSKKQCGYILIKVFVIQHSKAYRGS